MEKISQQEMKMDILLENQEKMKYQIHGSLGFLNGSIWFLIGYATSWQSPFFLGISIFFVILGLAQWIACAGRLGKWYFFGDQDIFWRK